MVEPLITSELLNQPIEVSARNKICHSSDFEAIKL